MAIPRGPRLLRAHGLEDLVTDVEVRVDVLDVVGVFECLDQPEHLSRGVLVERHLCRAHDVPAGTPRGGPLVTDVRRGRLPVTGELTPNFCHDGHDCPLRTADTWLGGWVPKLMSGPDYRSHRLTIVVTFDEDDGSAANRVAFVVIDPRLSHVVVRQRCDHYCLARWLAENAHVRPLRHAERARDLRRLFGL